MVVQGHDTTLPITLEEKLVHCRAVARGAKTPLLVGDLPFGTYESSSIQAVDTAMSILKEGGMDAIKLEGGSPSRIVTAKTIVEARIAVMGHLGFTPQVISVLGGFRPQGKNVASAVKVIETALALQEAGCFSVVLECVPAPRLRLKQQQLFKFLLLELGLDPFAVDTSVDLIALLANVLLTGLERERDIGRMNELLAEMEERKIQPSVVTFGILVNHLCKVRRIDEALQVFDRLRGKRGSNRVGIRPDVLLFNTLINGLCKAGREVIAVLEFQIGSVKI